MEGREVPRRTRGGAHWAGESESDGMRSLAQRFGSRYYPNDSRTDLRPEGFRSKAKGGGQAIEAPSEWNISHSEPRLNGWPRARGLSKRAVTQRMEVSRKDSPGFRASLYRATGGWLIPQAAYAPVLHCLDQRESPKRRGRNRPSRRDCAETTWGPTDSREGRACR